MFGCNIGKNLFMGSTINYCRLLMIKSYRTGFNIVEYFRFVTRALPGGSGGCRKFVRKILGKGLGIRSGTDTCRCGRGLEGGCGFWEWRIAGAGSGREVEGAEKVVAVSGGRSAGAGGRLRFREGGVRGRRAWGGREREKTAQRKKVTERREEYPKALPCGRE